MTSGKPARAATAAKYQLTPTQMREMAASTRATAKAIAGQDPDYAKRLRSNAAAWSATATKAGKPAGKPKRKTGGS